MHEVDSNTALVAKVDALTRKLDELVSNGQGASSSSRTILFCEKCGGGHETTECPIVISGVALVEQVDFVVGGQKNQGNPYKSTYNLGWRNHPNFS